MKVRVSFYLETGDFTRKRELKSFLRKHLNIFKDSIDKGVYGIEIEKIK